MRLSESRIRRIIREEIDSASNFKRNLDDQPPATSSQNTSKKPLMVAVADEDGNIIRLPEEEALRHYQAQVAATNRKADEMERALKGQREHDGEELRGQWAKSDEELRSMGASFREKLRQNHEAEMARQQKQMELSDVFGRVSIRILKQIQLSQAAGDESSVRAMFNLGNTLTAAHSASDEVKMKQLDRNTAKWGIDESRRRRRLQEGSSPSSVFNRIKDICEDVLMNKSLGMKPTVAEHAADRIRDALKDL